MNDKCYWCKQDKSLIEYNSHYRHKKYIFCKKCLNIFKYYEMYEKTEKATKEINYKLK